MTKTFIAFIFALVAVGCSQPNELATMTDLMSVDRSPHAFEDGLRAGHADVKTFGFCDHPFPREEVFLGYGTLYLSRFEGGYFKGCAIARKSTVAIPKKKPSQSPARAKIPATSRCEA